MVFKSEYCKQAKKLLSSWKHAVATYITWSYNCVIQTLNGENKKQGLFSQVCVCKADVPVTGGPFKSQRADIADRDEWVEDLEECGDKKKWEEDVRDKDERELRERENICITNPVCCYAEGKSTREAKPMFAIICERLRRQHLNQILIDNLVILSLRIPGQGCCEICQYY